MGVIAFGTTAEQLSEPTTDRSQALRALDSLKSSGAHRDGRRAPARDRRDPHADDRRRRAAAAAPRRDRAALRRREHRAAADPREVAQRAEEAQDPDLLGRARHAERRADAQGRLARRAVPPDTATLQSIARTTGGRFFTAPTARDLEAVYANLGRGLATKKEKQEVTAAFAGGALALLLGGLVIVAAADGAAAVRRGARVAHRRRSGTPERPGPGPVPDAVLRSLDLAVMRRIQSLVPGRLHDAAGRRGHRARDDPPLPAGRRRAPHRLERDRAHARAARARARRRARDDRVARARRVGLDELRHRAAAQGRRRRGRRARHRPRGDAARQPARRASRSATGPPRVLRPRQGRLGLLGAARRAARRGPRRADERAARRTAPGATLATPCSTWPRSRARAGSSSWSRDFRGARDWEAPAARAARAPRRARGRDPRPARARAAAPMGDLWMVDPETGRQIVVNTSRQAACASASAGRRGRGARRGRRRPAPRRRRPPRALAPTATGCATWPATCGAPSRCATARWPRAARAARRRARTPCPALDVPTRAPAAPASRRRRAPPPACAPPPRRGGARVSFREPAVLLGLVLSRWRCSPTSSMQRRRRREAAAFANPALMPNLLTAPARLAPARAGAPAPAGRRGAASSRSRGRSAPSRRRSGRRPSCSSTTCPAPCAPTTSSPTASRRPSSSAKVLDGQDAGQLPPRA